MVQCVVRCLLLPQRLKHVSVGLSSAFSSSAASTHCGDVEHGRTVGQNAQLLHRWSDTDNVQTCSMFVVLFQCEGHTRFYFLSVLFFMRQTDLLLFSLLELFQSNMFLIIYTLYNLI